MESKNVDITYSNNLDTKTIRKSETLQANWYGGGSFTVVVTVAHASVDTSDMPMYVKTAGFIDGIETDELSIDTAGQVVHMEDVIRLAKIPVDDDEQTHTLRLQTVNKSGYDVEVGLEVNGVRQVPLRLPDEGPLVP